MQAGYPASSPSPSIAVPFVFTLLALLSHHPPRDCTIPPPHRIASPRAVADGTLPCSSSCTLLVLSGPVSLAGIDAASSSLARINIRLHLRATPLCTYTGCCPLVINFPRLATFAVAAAVDTSVVIYIPYTSCPSLPIHHQPPRKTLHLDIHCSQPAEYSTRERSTAPDSRSFSV